MDEGTKIRNTQIVQFFFIMTVIGFIGNLRGILLPSIKQSLGINYTDIGFMIFISSIGYMCANLIGGIAGDRFGQRRVIMFGFTILPLGILGLSYTRSFPALLVFMTLVSIGLGSFDIGLNSLAPGIFIVNTAVMMNTMHFFYGVGSSASPKFAGWLLLKGLPWYSIYTYSLIIVALAFIPFILSPVKAASNTQHTSGASVFKLMTDIRILLFIGILGFSEAAEVGLGSWLVNFLQVERGMNQSISAQFMFYFFLIYTVGRMLGGHVVERLGYIRTVAASSAIVILLLIGGLSLDNRWTILFSITGFFISIMFPTIIAVISKVFHNNSSSVIGVVLTFAGMIGMMANWFIGRLNDSIGVFEGFASIPCYEVAFLVLLGILSRYLKAVNDKEELKQVEQGAGTVS